MWVHALRIRERTNGVGRPSLYLLGATNDNNTYTLNFVVSHMSNQSARDITEFYRVNMDV